MIRLCCAELVAESREMLAMNVAYISHKGPGSEFQKTYGMLMEWVEKNRL